MNVLIIGGTGTLGSAIVRKFAQTDKVLFTYFNNEQFAVELAQETNSDYFQFSTLHGVITVNNLDIYIDASGLNLPDDFSKVKPHQLRTVFDYNILGPFRTAQQVINNINDNGAMVFLSSSSVDTGGPRSVHYAASKAGIEAMTKGLARFVASRGIRVNAVAPGYIASPMADKALAPTVQKQIDGILLSRLGQPAEVADVVYWVARSTYINRQVIKVNGGML